jgi:predicted phage terminase large subunit-like protein
MVPNPEDLIRNDLPSFVRKAFYYDHGGTKLGNEPYIDYLCFELNKVATGETRRLVINLPPRHLKTFLGAIYLPAWVLAHDPAAKIMIVTNNDKLTEYITYHIRRILRSPWFKKAFKTRLAEDRARVGDFATTQGGEVFATSLGGVLAGRGASLIIVDDPLDIKDAGNIKQIEIVNQRFDGGVISRFDNSRTGRVIIIAHRLNSNDLSAHVLELGGWRHIVLSLVATRKKTYELGYRTWCRKPGDLLRPGSHTAKQLQQLQATTINPDFETFYQQAVGNGARIRIRREHFKLVSMHDYRTLPVVLSVDPGQSDRSSASYNVIQTWVQVEGNNHLLLDQWREQCRYKELQSTFWRFVRRFRPAACIIEHTANGPALIEDAMRKKWLKVIPIIPDGRSKTARLVAHIGTIQKGRIQLPALATWVEDYITEFVEFPGGGNDDQIDATTQYLDYMNTTPNLALPPQRALVVFGINRGRSIGQFPARLDLQKIGPVMRHYR